MEGADSFIRKGTAVVIRNLVARKHLNGLPGTLLTNCNIAGDDKTHRCEVQVHGSTGSFNIKVTPENLIPMLRQETPQNLQGSDGNEDDAMNMGRMRTFKKFREGLPRRGLKEIRHLPPKDGTEVVIRNLVGRKHLNGLTGTVVTHCDGSHEDITHRCRVLVHGSHDGSPLQSSSIVKVMPENLIPMSEVQRESQSQATYVDIPNMGITLLPTIIKLSLDEAEDKLISGGKLALESSLNSSMSTPNTSREKSREALNPRDPGRLRNLGLSFFRDSVEEEAHPANNATRKTRTTKVSEHTTKTGYDWRARFEPKHRDPWTIPSDQGGFAPSPDCSDRKPPVHPRLRSLLMGEEEEDIGESSEWAPLPLYTGAETYVPTKPETKAKAKSKGSRNRADELFRERVALSVKPVEERLVHGRHVDDDGTWDPLTWASQGPLLPAGAETTLEVSPSKSKVCPDETVSVETSNLFRGSDKTDWEIKSSLKNDQEFGDSHLEVLPESKVIQFPNLLLPSNEPCEEQGILSILQASAEEAERGFDFGVGAEKSTASLPWYECGGLASSMLFIDGPTTVENQTNGVFIADSLTLTASGGDSEVDWSEIAMIAGTAHSEE